MEQAIIGTLLQDRDAWLTVSEIIPSGTYLSNANNALFFDIIKDLKWRNAGVDFNTVTNELVLKQVDATVLIDLTELSVIRIETSNLLITYCEAVRDNYIRRDLTMRAGEIMMKGGDPEITLPELMTEVTRFGNLEDYVEAGSNIKEVGQAAAEVLAEYGVKDDRLATGLHELDKRILDGGYAKDELVIIAARPAMGKTAFILNVAYNMSENYNIGILALEMSAKKLTRRLVSLAGEINSKAIKNATLSPNEFQAFQHHLEDISIRPIYIDDGFNGEYQQNLNKIRLMKRKYNIDIVFIDYLQLMEGKGENRQNQISEISRRLKQLNKELGIPVVCLSQLSRAVETRGGSKRPQLSDLRESGAIEQDADIVQFLYRPEYYDIYEDEEGRSLKGVAEVITAKNRDGETGSTSLGFMGWCGKFKSLEAQEFIPLGPWDSKMET